MRALVVVHEPGSQSAMVGRRLEHHGIELVDVMITTEVGNPHGTFDVGSPSEYDLIVPMGSTYSVYDTASVGGWIDDELDFLRAADAADVPIFGICFGAQALAAAFGGRVVRSEEKQVGWHQFTAEVECGIPDGRYMQWHYDRFDPPPDATVLGRDHVGVQAFTFGRHLATQFHPEVDYAHLTGWLDGFGGEELRSLGIDPDQLLAETKAIEPEVTQRTNALVDWYLSDVAKL